MEEGMTGEVTKAEQSKELDLSRLYALLAQVHEMQGYRREMATFPGLDSYVPSFVSSGSDTLGAHTWATGMKF
jgi:hypothetical protein